MGLSGNKPRPQDVGRVSPAILTDRRYRPDDSAAKAAVAESIARGVSLRATARSTGVPYGTVNKWARLGKTPPQPTVHVNQCTKKSANKPGNKPANKTANKPGPAPSSTKASTIERAERKHRSKVRAALAAGGPVPEPTRGFDIPNPPMDPIDLPVLISNRKEAFSRRLAAEDSARAIDVRVRVNGPFGILHFGDPHIDDDGTDIEALERQARLTRSTPGLFAGNVGDTTNNWIGRLARLYGEQSTSAAEAWALADWWLSLADWLYIIGGNHDAWSGAGDPLKWISGRLDALYRPSEARLALHSPNGRRFTVNARHDFAGSSIWNPTHGAMKAAQLGVRDDVMICGHKHVSGYGIVKDPESKKLCHCIQLGSFKVFDRYAKEKGLRDQMVSPSAVTVFDPEATDPTGTVTVFFNAEEGAEFLTWKRQRAGV